MALPCCRNLNGSSPSVPPTLTVSQVVLQLGTASGNIQMQNDQITPNTGATNFVLTYTPVAGYPVDIYINGILLTGNGKDYNIAGTTVYLVGGKTFGVANGIQDFVQAFYAFLVP